MPFQEHDITQCLEELVAHLEKLGSKKESMKSVYMHLQTTLQHDIENKERLRQWLRYFSGYLTKGPFGGDPFCGGHRGRQAEYEFRQGYEYRRVEMLLDFFEQRLRQLNASPADGRASG